MQDGIYRFGEFALSPADRRLTRTGEYVALPPLAFDALELLVRRHGTLVPRAELFAALWPGVHVTQASLTNIIVLLRKILGHESIQTSSKYGYRFNFAVIGEPGISQAAYSCFVRGKELLAERSAESIGRAQDQFLLCLAHDPDFAAGWAWLGRTRRLLEKFAGHASAPELAEAAYQRAFVLDPDLACAHQFYTQLQVDSGQALQAMERLALRSQQHGADPESMAGLVQVLRYCGLLDESVAAHERAVGLDPTIKTSVAHTHFLRGEFARVFETYTGELYYLDAAAWAALGAKERAADLLRTRLSRPELGPVMRVVMASLLTVLEGRNEDTVQVIESAEIFREPEMLFYLARHLGMANARAQAVRMLRRARLGGFWSSVSMENDEAFSGVKELAEFQSELKEAKKLEVAAAEAFHNAFGDGHKWALPGPIRSGMGDGGKNGGSASPPRAVNSERGTQCVQTKTQVSKSRPGQPYR